MITEDNLEEFLKTKGITFDEETNDFNNLLEILKLKIASKIGIPLNPTKRFQIERNFNGSSIVIDYYPVHKINSITINGKEISEDEYILDCSDGIIYFNNLHVGLLKMEYEYCISEDQYNQLIIPLIIDMFEYHFDNSWNKDATSIHEGDVSVSFDASVGKGALIQKQLDELKEQFSTIGRMV